MCKARAALRRRRRAARPSRRVRRRHQGAVSTASARQGVYGAFCGDGKAQKPYEECDDENSGDGCSPACKYEVSVPK